MASQTIKLGISEASKIKRDKLLAIFDHVTEITNKISCMNDPLPRQLEQSIPGYLDIVNSYTEELKRTKYSIVVTGDKYSSQSRCINQLIGYTFLPTSDENLNKTLIHIAHDSRSWAKVYQNDVEGSELVLEDGSLYQSITESITKRNQFIEKSSSEARFQSKVQLYLPVDVLKNGCAFTSLPVFDQEPLNTNVTDLIVRSCGVIYTVDVDTEASSSNKQVKLEKFEKLFQKLSTTNVPLVQQAIGPNSFLFLCYIDEVANEEEIKALVLTKLREHIPTLSESQVILIKENDAERNVAFLGRISDLIAEHQDNRLHLAYSWMHSFVSRVLYHLRAFLSQSEKSHEERLATFTAIQNRLQQLHCQAAEFLRCLQTEVDSKVQEAAVLIRNHLSNEEVVNRLSQWNEDEAPVDQVWQDVNNAISEKISERIGTELKKWEDDNKFFQNVRPYLVQNFEKKFVGIEAQLSSVEFMIARHDSHLNILDIEHHTESMETAFRFLPESITLNLGQKIALGIAAPFLLPFALTLAVLALPVLGGIMGGIAAKDLIQEKIAENKLKEYNTDKMKYLRKRTSDEVKRFAKSKVLVDRYIKSKLKHAYACIEQLQEVVPRQIDADKAHVQSLRNDDRESKDFVRFYQPLLEIFEHDRQMLTAFRVISMTRDKIDIPFESISYSESCKPLCKGLHYTIFLATQSYQDKDQNYVTKNVSLKKLHLIYEAHEIDDYLQEEETHRFQACPNVIKFFGICKNEERIYHVLEPATCSFRKCLTETPEVSPIASDRQKFTFLRRKLLEVVTGLDYIHDRGWIHGDLSLDTIVIDSAGRAKLTNIGLRKIISLNRNIPKEDVKHYTHLAHEVLVDPPAAYTPTSEMYSVGIMMWEAWTGHRAYWQEIDNPEININSLNSLVEYIEFNRPKLGGFLLFSGDEPTSQYAGSWMFKMQQCWAETERLNAKAWIQLMDESKNQHLPLEEAYFGGE